MFGFGIVPKNWAQCNGQLLAIQQNQALFSILGITYGGNGTTNFALPNLQGRVPSHWGNSPLGFAVTLGQSAGEETHLLTVSEMPMHTHFAVPDPVDPNASDPSGALWSKSKAPVYGAYGTSDPAQLAAEAITTVGGGQPHNNMSPYLAVNFCIALTGIFPSRN